MTGRSLKRQKVKIYFFNKKNNRNPFAWFVQKTKKIPINIIFAIFFVLVSFFLLKEEKIRNEKRILGLQTQLKADQKAAFDWEQILLEKPNYRDGWFYLSAIYYRLGQIEKAKEALEKAKELDPLNENLISWEKFLKEAKNY